MITTYTSWGELFEQQSYTIADKPDVLYRISQNKWQYQMKNSNRKDVWHWVTNLSSVQTLNKKYGKTLLVHVDRPEARPIIDSDKVAIIKQINSTGKSLGWSENAIASVIGNAGRENSLILDRIVGQHTDPKNKAKNFGIFSWQGQRLLELQKFLKSKGLLEKTGSAKRSLSSVDAMLRFIDGELDSQGGNSKIMRDKNATTDQISKMLKNYIRYSGAPYNAPDPKFNVAKNHIWAASAKLGGLINYT